MYNAQPMTTRTKLLWVAALYFAEGFPLGLVYDLLPVYFRAHGVSLSAIGLLSLVGLPWTLKFLWAPAVDVWGERRHWMIGCQIGMAFVLMVVPFLDPSPPSGLFWTLLFCLPLFSATQDIAIDAYTIELMDPREMGRANGVRMAAYRVALMSMGGLLAVVGWTSLGGGWTTAFFLGALCLILLALISSRASDRWTGRLPVEASSDLPGRMIEATAGAFRQLSAKPGFLIVMLFILLFKLGDMAMGPMIKPFWVDRGFTPAQIGLVSVTIGVAMTTLGALIGGWLADRWGIFSALWILGLTQAGSNLLYAAAAWMPASTPLIYTASVVESFTGGLGTGPFLAFLMNICDKRHAATQYALLSALFGLTRVVSGAVSGVAAQQLGYASYFLLTFFLSFPAYLLLPFVKPWAQNKP
jgi:PAT family beta-lactamase induction signal transducer AmpG